MPTDGNSVVNPNSSVPPPAPLLQTFTQGLWRGEDVRVSNANGFYYTVYSVGNERQMFKSASLIDRGVGRQTPPNFPLYAPQWIDQLGGTTYNAWFAFDGNVWRCDCSDPYEQIDQWVQVKSIPFTSVSLDFEVFKNPQAGAFQNRWYMVWAGASYGTVGWGPESLYIAEVLDLRADQPTLSNSNNLTSNMIVQYHENWTGAVVEGPGAFILGDQVSLVYSGNGAQTDDYALGIAILRPGADPTLPNSWIDHNYYGCDGDLTGSPEFAATDTVWGPGVARHTLSADGTEDWMLYHSKVWATYQANDGPADQQTHNQQWTRQVSLQHVGWRAITCDGNAFTIPALGTPVTPGTAVTAPAGDRGLGPLDAPRRVEGELWLPYGVVMGPSIQSIAGPDGDLDVITPADPNCSAGEKIINLAALAADSNTTPAVSGLLWHNAPPASGLRIANACSGACRLDLYVNGDYVTAIPFTGGAANPGEFAIADVGVAIPRGATVDLRFAAGGLPAPDLDYIEFLP